VVELKGQLTIQYLASFIFFIGLIVYIYFAYSTNLPAFVEEARKEDVRSKAFQLSEVLVNDPGKPLNWDEVPLPENERLGLADENSNKTNLISLKKVKKLDDLCVNFDFELIQKLLALDKPFSIHIFNISQDSGKRNQLMAPCVSPDFPKTTINATIKRITALNNTETGELELAEIIVQM